MTSPTIVLDFFPPMGCPLALVSLEAKDQLLLSAFSSLCCGASTGVEEVAILTSAIALKPGQQILMLSCQ